MTTKELYAQIGGNYEEALSRLSMDSLVERFIIRFLDDESCSDLIAVWDRGDEDAAFKAAHTAKGVCANLALTDLCSLASQICEALRPGNSNLRAQTDVDALVDQFRELYASVVQKIRAFQAQ